MGDRYEVDVTAQCLRCGGLYAERWDMASVKAAPCPHCDFPAVLHPAEIERVPSDG